MSEQEEKRLILQGIELLTEEMKKDNFTLETIRRYHTLIDCLVTLNWKECGQRQGEGQNNSTKVS